MSDAAMIFGTACLGGFSLVFLVFSLLLVFGPIPGKTYFSLLFEFFVVYTDILPANETRG